MDNFQPIRVFLCFVFVALFRGGGGVRHVKAIILYLRGGRAEEVTTT